MKTGEISGLAAHWNALAGDAKWAVLSDPAARGGQWDEEAFWRTGRADVSAVLADCARLGLTLRRDRALDFGSGVGRLCRALASEFGRVEGVDISSTMVEIARRGAPPNVSFHENRAADLRLYPSATFDLVLTLIVLQHMPPPLMLRYLREFHRVLRPGGVLYFQVPDAPRVAFSSRRIRTVVRRAAFRVPGVKSAWRRARGELPIEMYGLPEARVKQTLEGLGFTLLSAVEDEAAGEDWRSVRYIAQRR